MKIKIVLLFCVALAVATVVTIAQRTERQTIKPVAATTVSISNQTFDGTRVEKSEDEWKNILTADAFYVLRQKGTERAYTGKLTNNKRAGVYTCGACGLHLFSSKHKFESGTGWPSFYQVIAKANVLEEVDNSLEGETRTEVLCARCGSHLGHVFDDGPEPTGLRYCINSVALKFQAGK